MKCSTCNTSHAVTVTQSIKIGRRVVEWRLCVGCELRERAAGDERADAADVQAERARVA